MTNWEHPWHPFWRQMTEPDGPWLRSDQGRAIHYIPPDTDAVHGQREAVCGRWSFYWYDDGYVGAVCMPCLDTLTRLGQAYELDRLPHPQQLRAVPSESVK